MIRPKVAIICYPFTKSSYVMECFEKAGFNLGDVDRNTDEGYPAGRLELRQLAALTSGKSKTQPLVTWPQMNLDDVDVAKCLPAWIPVLKNHGFNYWVAMCRTGTVCNATEHPHDEVITSGNVDPKEIWARAYAHLSARSSEHSERNPSAQAFNEEGLHGKSEDDQLGTAGGTMRSQKRGRKRRDSGSVDEGNARRDGDAGAG